MKPVDVGDLEDPTARQAGDVIPVDADDAHLLRVEVERAASQFLDLADDRIAVSEEYAIEVLSVGAGCRDGRHEHRE